MSSLLYDSPGPRGRFRAKALTIISVVATVLLSIWIAVRLKEAGLLNSDLWSILLHPEFLTLLGHGLLATTKAAVVAMGLSVSLGAIMAALMNKQSALLQGFFRVWIEVFRGLPLLLLIFFLFLGGPAIGIEISTFWALVLGITLYNGAVFAEIFRAGIASLHKGQAEAGLAIGLTKGEVFRIILLPQSVIRMLPALLSQLITILKETSLGFVIGYSELLRDARSAVEYLGGEYSLPVYVLIAAIYITVSCAISALANKAQSVI